MCERTIARPGVRTRDLVLCALFSALVAVGAFIRIPVPVMPFTMQFFFTNLAGILLGRRLGSAAVGVYVVLGLSGLPVFTHGGGLGYIFQPTFGYLIGFVAGTWLAGAIAERAEAKRTTGKTRMLAYLLAGFVNLGVVYLLGVLHYYMIANYYLHQPIGTAALVFYCFVLAVPGDILLCLLSGLLAKRLKQVLERERRA